MDQTNSKAMEFFVTGLRNQHAVENQAIEILGRQVERLENYPELEAKLRQHIDESKMQAQRLDELLAGRGTSASSVKDTVMSLVGNMAALAHSPAPDEVIKNTFANYAFEHFEIAAYKSLISVAEAIGQTPALSALKLSLSEEESIAAWLEENIGPTSLRYVRRLEAGEKAGV